MAFPFLCPQGHLLQADESQVGQQMQCPYCGSVFLVPQPLPTGAPDPSAPAPPGSSDPGPQAGCEQPPARTPFFQPPDAGDASSQPAAGAPPEAHTPDFPGIRTEPPPGRAPAASKAPSEFRVRTTADLIERDALHAVDQIRNHARRVAHFSFDLERSLEELEAALRETVYGHPRLIRMDSKARRFIERMYEAYVAEPRLLPPRYVRRVESLGRERVICDYIAGMTDRYCQDEYKRLFEPFERV